MRRTSTGTITVTPTPTSPTTAAPDPTNPTTGAPIPTSLGPSAPNLTSLEPAPEGMEPPSAGKTTATPSAGNIAATHMVRWPLGRSERGSGNRADLERRGGEGQRWRGA
jgi:hypothetical protein